MPENPSHADILKAIGSLQKDVGVILMDLQGLKSQVQALIRCVGEEKEDDHGQLYGTGLVGKHMRLAARVDKRFRSFDDWRNYAMGALGASTLLIAAIWWIIKYRIEELLR